MTFLIIIAVVVAFFIGKAIIKKIIEVHEIRAAYRYKMRKKAESENLRRSAQNAVGTVQQETKNLNDRISEKSKNIDTVAGISVKNLMVPMLSEQEISYESLRIELDEKMKNLDRHKSQLGFIHNKISENRPISVALFKNQFLSALSNESMNSGKYDDMLADYNEFIDKYSSAMIAVCEFQQVCNKITELISENKIQCARLIKFFSKQIDESLVLSHSHAISMGLTTLSFDEKKVLERIKEINDFGNDTIDIGNGIVAFSQTELYSNIGRTIGTGIGNVISVAGEIINGIGVMSEKSSAVSAMYNDAISVYKNISNDIQSAMKAMEKMDSLCQCGIILSDRYSRLRTSFASNGNYCMEEENCGDAPITLNENELEIFYEIIKTMAEIENSYEKNGNEKRKKNNDQLYDQTKKAAESGNADAQLALGNRYYNGDGALQDYFKAVEWYRKAAEQGNTSAQYNLGNCYSDGKGVQQDYAKAVEWFQKAADQGLASAQDSLGDCYHLGYGVLQNDVKAAGWYQKAVDQGFEAAKLHMGYCYYFGKGVPQNYCKAAELLQKASEDGKEIAQYLLGNCYYDGNGVPQNYSKAAEWYQKAAGQGYAKAQNALGNCYYNGKGVQQNYIKAVEWFQKSAEQGNATAQCNLGNCYYCGDGVTQDYAKAVEWFQKSAELGNANAQSILGNCYYCGEGVTQDYAKAVEWSQKAAEHGSAVAQFVLGICYLTGEGVLEDITKAKKLIQKSAEKGYCYAQCVMGDWYEEGEKMPKDHDKAIEWYRKSANQGNEDAIKALKRLGESMT